jgi:penicillin-binding protein 1C
MTASLTTLHRSAEEYGLPLILGGCEVTLFELTNLYCALAHGGTWSPLRVLQGEEVQNRRRLFSREAAHLVSQGLATLERPDLPRAWRLARGIPEVAWKTGTSYGHRDAWAVGFSNRHTIGVWVGSFDGRACEGISGARNATPLLFHVFRALELDGTRLAEPFGLEINKVEVCSLSHELPGPFCPERTEITFLPGRAKLKRCSYHQRAFIDAETGDIVKGKLTPERPYRQEVLTVYPSDLVAWWRSEGQPIPDIPTVANSYPVVPAGESPGILSPQNEGHYLLRRDAVEGHQKISLVAQAGPETRRLYWYQDGILRHAATPGDELFLDLEPGRHRLVVVSDLGLSDSITYYVEGSLP